MVFARAASSRAVLAPCFPTAAPLSALLAGPLRRAFASTPSPRRRGEPIKLLPEWSWRRPWRDNPVPLVEVVSTAEAAEAVLETFTSRRLSIDAEPGIAPGATRAQRNSGTARSKACRHGVLSIADGEGVVVLHLANMDRFPETLKWILEDDKIEKQMLGAAWWIHEILDTPAFYGECSPRRVVDLRRLAEIAYPALAEPDVRSLVHNSFIAMFAKDMLGLRYAVLDMSGADGGNFYTKKLQGPRLEALVNQTWFAHCAGAVIRDKVAERLAFKVERNGVLPVPAFLKPELLARVEQEAYRAATYDGERARGIARRATGLEEHETGARGGG
ncbi:hypothetical protein JCM3770_000013 [Rhodotorula araucariae]